MGIELQGAAVEQLRDIARMAYGYGFGEKTKGGAGNIGLLGDHVVKFNTHSRERGGAVTDEMRASGQALRARLLGLAGDVLANSPAQEATMKKITEMLGTENPLDKADGEKPKSLLDRKVVAKVINLIDQETNLGLWQTSGNGDSSKNISMTFKNVVKAVGYDGSFLEVKDTFPKASEAVTRRETKLFVNGKGRSITFSAGASEKCVAAANATLAQVHPAEKFSDDPIPDDDEKAWKKCCGQLVGDLQRSFNLVLDDKLYGCCFLGNTGAKKRFEALGATKMNGEMDPKSHDFVAKDLKALRDALKAYFTKDGKVDWRSLRQFCDVVHQGVIVDLFSLQELGGLAPIPYRVSPASIDTQYDNNKFAVVSRDAQGRLCMTFDCLDSAGSLQGEFKAGDGFLTLDPQKSHVQRKATIVFEPGKPPVVQEGSVIYTAHLVKDDIQK